MDMKKYWLLCFMLVLLVGCTKEDVGYTDADGDKYALTDGVSEGVNSGEQNEGQPGVITAGEWNDLSNWTFLDSLLQTKDYAGMNSYWSFYLNNRVSVRVTYNGTTPAVDETVNLKLNGATVWIAKTDNEGKAELWVDVFQKNGSVNFSQYEIAVGDKTISDVKKYSDGINTVQLTSSKTAPTRAEIAFVVDATGSMSDELEFLKTELLDVVSKAQTANPSVSIFTGSVFYRDEGDDYLTRVSDFSSDIDKTLNFIKAQRADGGGDFPEAVHTALDKAVNNLQWSSQSRTRILFLLLDAPPHYQPAVIADLQKHIKSAASKGIRIIPVTASGIDKETEFLMRFMASVTNGTYVFITNDSGVGNDHLEPTVGAYQVELLNKLMLRLINKYLSI
ncbi:MAG: von Willebrand factor type A-like protein [Bacteroidetes bacterium]|nr:von Willebrand factor type A-like protein [Bacteroidota bacterium]